MERRKCLSKFNTLLFYRDEDFEILLVLFAVQHVQAMRCYDLKGSMDISCEEDGFS